MGVELAKILIELKIGKGFKWKYHKVIPTDIKDAKVVFAASDGKFWLELWF